MRPNRFSKPSGKRLGPPHLTPATKSVPIAQQRTETEVPEEGELWGFRSLGTRRRM